MLSPAVKTRTSATRQASSSSSASAGSSVPDAGAGGGRRTPSGHGPSSGSSSGATDRGDRDSAVRVVVRVRPQSKREVESGGTDCVSFPSEDSIEINGAKKTYDRVFTPKATQREVFDYVAKPLVAELFNGYNGTIFAYGQTSSGKTHTMEGPSIHDPELAGVIPRTVREIFLSVAEAPESVEFIIKVSYIEIYMEKIRDLLDTYHKKVNLPVREDKQRGVYVAGATEEYVTSADELISVMSTGAKNRVVAATGMNQGSSRSHSVFIISLQQRDTNDSSTKTGMLFLVDLAGSEMVKKTHATGQVLEEAKTINKSLSALGQVINALTDDKKPHVPYRDSKLTRVLQNSLGGNSKTCLIVNCSPSSFNEAETQSTLRFGSRAKRIQNKAVVNETRSVEELSALLGKAEATLELQQTYIAALEKQLKAKASKNGKGGGASQPPPAPSGGPSTDGGDNSGSTSPSTTQDAEAASAIRRLTERNHALLAELEEEKAEVKRSRQEVNELRGVLQERDVQLEEAAAMLSDTKKRHVVRQEGLVAEKADVVGELEAMRNRLQEVMQAHEFENKERSLTIEKLQGENSRLADELRELTGDAVEKAPASNSLQPPARQSTPATSPASKLDEAQNARTAAAGSETKEKESEVRREVKVTSATEGRQDGGKGAEGGATKGEQVPGEESKLKEASSEKAAGKVPAATGEAAATKAEEARAKAESEATLVAADTPSETEAATGTAAAAVAEEAVDGADKSGAGESENVNDNEKGSNESAPTESGPDEWDPAALESAGATEDVLTMVRAREQAWRVWESSMTQESKHLRERAIGERERFNRTRQELDKRLADNEQHREQLVHDLQKEEQRVIELERAAEGKGDGLAERERKHQVDIQKRLEQLVAVHRQLLRRYGGLELENSEYRKKIHLRNERMAQLQRNTELLSMTMKEQAERHVAELSSLREQVSSLHEQQQQRRERAVMYPPPYHRERRRIIRGGGADHQVHEVKIIHGGSRRFAPEDMPWGGIGPRESSVGSLTTSPVRSGRGSNGSGTEPETPSTPRSATAGLWSTGESLLERLATAALPSRGRSPSTSK